jgi:hypothetical protein
MIVFALILRLLPCLGVGMPLLMLEARRNASRRHRPQPNELWSQDSAQLLFVEATMRWACTWWRLTGYRRRSPRGSESWEQWQARCRKRAVLFTGRSGTIDPWEAMIT